MKYFKSAVIVILIFVVVIFTGLKIREKIGKNNAVPVSAQTIKSLENEGLKELNFKDVYGVEYTLDSFKGKILIINFWASWCDPCIQEFPSMLNLLKEFPDKIEIVAISEDDSEMEIVNFLKAFKISGPNKVKNFKVTWDKDKVFSKKFSVTAMPESFIMNVDNKLIRKVSGSDNWSSPTAIEFFKEILKNPHSTR